jgi:hypothetical protein
MIAMIERFRAFLLTFAGPTLDDLRRSARSWSAVALAVD